MGFAAATVVGVKRLTTVRWMLVHLGVVVLVAAFLGLGWWQIGRARGGNALSFGYAIEWPFFAGFVIWVWVKEMRRVLRGTEAPPPVPADPPPPPEPARPRSTTRQQPRSGPAYDDTDDAELAAYNDYLAWLNANPGAHPADYPGPVPSKEMT